LSIFASHHKILLQTPFERGKKKKEYLPISFGFDTKQRQIALYLLLYAGGG
jgi:hypothetical protein